MKPHIAMTCLGTLPGGEMFSFGLSLGHRTEIDTPIVFVGDLAPNSTIYDDLATDCAEYFAGLPLNNGAALRSVKFAPIGTDGKYSGPPVERSVGLVNIGVEGKMAGTRFPNQIALAVTLHTEGDLGRVKGRYYLPLPDVSIGSDGRMAESIRDDFETRSQTFINDINDQPGLDVLDLRVVVASSGRHNKDGSVKIGPMNHDVTAVSVGRVLDTIRRRRNKLGELRGVVSGVS